MVLEELLVLRFLVEFPVLRAKELLGVHNQESI
jgi:hypothetical protein